MVGRGDLSVRRVEQQARQSARKASPWLVGLGRLGYAVEGVVYALIGILAVQVALGRGGATTDNKGALVQIAGAPFGRFLLIVVTLGLIGYALWRFLQAALDVDGKGTTGKGIAKRVGYAATGAVHIFLALSAVRLLQTGSAGANGDTSARGWTAELLSKPFGQWLVAIVGLVVIGMCGYQVYSGLTARFREDLTLTGASPTEDQWFTRLGQIGYSARGVVFALIGLFLVVAARRGNPGEAHGLDGALATLAQQPFGPWLLGIVALGLIAYGVFLFAEARYQRMSVA